MAISYHGVGTVNNPVAGTSIIVPMPAGVAAGDLLYAAVVYVGSGSGVSITPPSGWTQLQSTNTGNTAHDLQFYTYYRRAGSSEPSTYTWALGGTGVQNCGMILRFQGVSVASATDVLSYQQGQGTTASMSATTTTVDNTWLLFTCGYAADIATGLSFPTPANYTSRATITNAGEAELQCASRILAAAGTTGTTSVTTDAAGDDWWAVQLTVLKPDVPSTEPIIGAGNSLTNRMRAMRGIRGTKVFCGWLNQAGDPGALIPATLLPVYDLPIKPKLRVRLGHIDTPRPNNTSSPLTPRAASTGSLGPRISLPPQTLTDDAQWMRQSAAWMNEANRGHLQNTGIVTLNANESNTVVLDDRVGTSSFIGFMPRTAAGAAELRSGTLYVATGKQTFTITHANNAQTDRTFVYTILG